ncbi:transcriptional regulator [bacterium]|nr:transcriptional regulator [bacterium]
MPTSTRFAVAVHVLSALALHEGKPVCSDLLAQSAGTNPVVIRRLLAMLAKAGLARSQPGVGGGTVLTREPDSITLLEVYLAVEDAALFALPRCAPNENCRVGRSISPILCNVTSRAQKAMETELQSMTLADVVRGM